MTHTLREMRLSLSPSRTQSQEGTSNKIMTVGHEEMRKRGKEEKGGVETECRVRKSRFISFLSVDNEKSFAQREYDTCHLNSGRFQCFAVVVVVDVGCFCCISASYTYNLRQ